MEVALHQKAGYSGYRDGAGVIAAGPASVTITGVLPASANEDGEVAIDLQGGGGHSLEDLMCDWFDISYVYDTPVPWRQDKCQEL